MNEMEIFLELIDEKEANRILKYFGETPLGTRQNKATLEQKKQHLKKVFKSATPKMIRRRIKGSADPFYTFIQSYAVPNIRSVDDFIELITFMNESSEIPPYIRFAVLFLKFPEEVKSRFKEIERNIKNGKDPLLFESQFKADEDLKNYMRKMRSFIGEKAPINIVKAITEIQPRSFSDDLEKCKEIIKKYSLLQYYNSKDEFEEEYSLAVSNTAYILTHKNEDYDITMLLAVEAMYNLMVTHRNNTRDSIKVEINEIKSELINKEKVYEKAIKEKKDEISKLKIEYSKLKRNMNIVVKEKEKVEDKIVDWQTRFLKGENDLKVTVDKYTKLIEKIESDFKSQNEKVMKDLDFKRIIEAERMNKFKPSNSETYNWGICLTDYELTNELYPELFVANSNDKNEINRLLTYPSIDTIYVLMKGLSTKQFNYLKMVIEKNKKTYEVLDFDDYKEFIDWIGYKKTIERNAMRK